MTPKHEANPMRDPMDAWDDDSPGVLHQAAAAYSPEELEGILRARRERGRDIDERWTGGATALHFAYQANRLDNVDVLVEFGADSRAVNGQGLTPRQTWERQALTSGERRLAQLLRRLGKVWICSYQADGARQRPPSLFERDINFDTALHLATIYLDPDDISFLVEQGLNVNERGDLGLSPLQIAFLWRRHENAERLLTLGADPQQPCRAGFTADAMRAAVQDGASPSSRALHGKVVDYIDDVWALKSHAGWPRP